MQRRRSCIRYARAGWLLVLLLCACVDALAEVPSPLTARFRRLDDNDGLSQSSVLAVVQDRHGFVWIGTRNGLNRYDGYDFRHYLPRLDAPGGIAGDQVRALAIAPDGTLWVATNAGLSRYIADQDRFETLRRRDGDPTSIAHDDIHALAVDGDGTLWVGTWDGISRYDPASGGFTSYRPAQAPAAELDDNRVRALSAAPDGGLWLGTVSGVTRFDPATQTFSAPHLHASGADAGLRGFVNGVLADRRNRVWIAIAGAGLSRYDPATDTVLRLRNDPADPQSLGTDETQALLEDDAGRIWIGTRDGLELLAEPDAVPARFVRFAHQRHAPRSLGSGRVMSLWQDARGMLWIGTYSGGVSLLDGRGPRFASFDGDHPATRALRDPAIYSLGAAGPDQLWLGSRNGVYRFDLVTGLLEDFPATAGLSVGAIQPFEGRLWLSTNDGPRILDPGDGTTVRPAVDAGLAAERLTKLRLDPPLAWFGTYERNLHVVAMDAMHTQQVHAMAASTGFIEPLNDSIMLVGSRDGLHWYTRDGTRELYHTRAQPGVDGALQVPAVTAFLRAQDGRMWLGTYGGGLYLMDLPDPGDPTSARYTAYTTRHGLPSDVLTAMLEDAQGRLWISTFRGLSRFDPARGEFRNFQSADGAFSSDYQDNSAVALTSGAMAFGAPRGFTVFDPLTIVDAPPPARPVLTELRLWNRPVDPDPHDADAPLHRPLHLSDELQLSAEAARMVTLRFAAPEFVDPTRQTFGYRLDPQDADWIETDAHERSATYTRLAPGRYTFRVRAGNADGLWGTEETQLALVVLPPWWQTAWARMLAALAFFGALFGLHVLRTRRIRARQRELQQQVDRRTGELREALDELRRTQHTLVEQEKMASLGGLVAGVAHEINTPIGIAVTAASHVAEATSDVVRRIDSGDLRRSDLGRLREACDEGMRLVLRNLERASTLIASFKQVAVDQSSEQRRRFDLADFLSEIVAALQPSYRRQGHQVRIDCPSGITMDTYPGALFQIVTNLISNSVLHAYPDERSGLLLLIAHRDGDLVEIRYRDDGVGMPADVAARAFEPFFTTRRSSGGSGLGLHLAYNLASHLLGGTIMLRSAPGEGVEFTLRIPTFAPVREDEVTDGTEGGSRPAGRGPHAGGEPMHVR